MNLLSGLIAVIFALKGELTLASFFILLGILFDFFDGFAARLLDVSGELGKQLDSLSDAVTSGVAPAMIMYKLLEKSQGEMQWFQDLSCTIGSWVSADDKTIYFFPFLGLLLAIASVYRLANFNIDERQTSSFIGLPTPAMALFIASIPLIIKYSENLTALNVFQNKYILIGVTIIFSLLMNANIPLFSLKVRNYSFKDNVFVYIFLLISLVLLILLKFVAIPIIILLYVLISIIQNVIDRNEN